LSGVGPIPAPGNSLHVIHAMETGYDWLQVF
jgi:hypothetical protein